jgi:hypothetical protein
MHLVNLDTIKLMHVLQHILTYMICHPNLVNQISTHGLEIDIDIEINEYS